MNRIAIVGAQWGDEGKGKLVNYYAPNFDWVVRYAGGSNAGHTIYHEGRKYVNHLLPSIALDREECRGYMGAGMVLDLEQLLAELKTLEADFPGISRRFHVDPEAFVVLPWHRQEDALLESHRRRRIGTTGRGIGPAYADKASRLGIKVLAIEEEAYLRELLEDSFEVKSRLCGETISPSPAEVHSMLRGAMERLCALGVQFSAAVEMAEHLPLNVKCCRRR